MNRDSLTIGAAAVFFLGLFVFSPQPAHPQFQALPDASPVSGPPLEWSPSCGTPDVEPATAAWVREKLRRAEGKSLVDGDLEIPVALHLITSGKKGKFSRDVADLLINNLNAAFSGTGFSFYLAKLDYTNNRKWYEGCGFLTANEKAMKKKLAYYPAQVLNMYSCKPSGKGIPSGVIGFAYFPWMFPESSYMQGVVVHPGTLPTGAGIPNYDYYGLNAVHETATGLACITPSTREPSECRATAPSQGTRSMTLPSRTCPPASVPKWTPVHSLVSMTSTTS